MKICKDLVYFMLRYLPLGLVVGSFGVTSKNYVRLDIKCSTTHCKGFEKITFGANTKISILKASQISWKTCAKSLLPIGSHPIIHLVMSVGLNFVFNHLPHSLYLHVCTNFSFTLPHGQLIFFG